MYHGQCWRGYVNILCRWDELSPNLMGQNLTQELSSQLWQRRAWKTEAEEKHQHVWTDRVMDHEIADITVWAHWRALFCKLLGFVNLNGFAFLILSWTLSLLLLGKKNKKPYSTQNNYKTKKDRRASWACCNLAYLAVSFGEVTLSAGLGCAAGLLGEK